MKKLPSKQKLSQMKVKSLIKLVLTLESIKSKRETNYLVLHSINIREF